MTKRTSDRRLPVYITLVVIGFMLMTFDIRSEREGALSVVRSGIGTIVEPLQKVVGVIVNPVADFLENVADVRSLRSENQALRAQVAAYQAKQAANSENLERLAQLEIYFNLELPAFSLSRTEANVIGRTDSFDGSFRIDRGEEAGITAGNPVLDHNGFLVGRVLDSMYGQATIVPIVGDIEAITVATSGMVGTLSSVIGSGNLLVLDVFDNAEVVIEGDQVVTSPLSYAFPPGIPVGEIAATAIPNGKTPPAYVRPYADFSSLRIVAVLAWPIDPDTATSDDLTVPTTQPPIGSEDGGE